MTLRTIRQTASTGFLSEYRLRQMKKQNKLPGVYSGNRFLIDIDMLSRMLEQESAKNMEERKC